MVDREFNWKREAKVKTNHCAVWLSAARDAKAAVRSQSDEIQGYL